MKYYAIQDFGLDAYGPTVKDAFCVQKGESLVTPCPEYKNFLTYIYNAEGQC